jgi:hypothetical protein
VSAAGVVTVAFTSRAGEVNRPYKVGGLSFVAVGILFLSKYLLDLQIGPPPSSGAEILVWRTANELPLAITNEILFFVVVFLVPSVVALYWTLADSDRTKAAAGCGLIAAMIPIILMLGIVHGRLVYPVYGLRVDTPAVAELVIAVYYGGLHAIGLVFVVATAVLSLAMRRGIFGRNIAYLGFAAAAFDFLGAYPETIGPMLVLVSQVLFATWFVAVGSKLFAVRAPVAGHSVVDSEGEGIASTPAPTH